MRHIEICTAYVFLYKCLPHVAYTAGIDSYACCVVDADLTVMLQIKESPKFGRGALVDETTLDIISRVWVAISYPHNGRELHSREGVCY